MIEFRDSGKTVEWDDSYENILDLAEANGIDIESNCLIGVCGTCKVELLSGEVDMEQDEGLEDEDRDNNMILPCVSIPLTDVVIKA